MFAFEHWCDREEVARAIAQIKQPGILVAQRILLAAEHARHKPERTEIAWRAAQPACGCIAAGRALPIDDRVAGSVENNQAIQLDARPLGANAEERIERLPQSMLITAGQPVGDGWRID